MSWDDASWSQAAHRYHKDRGGRRSVVEHDANRLTGLRRLLDSDLSIDRAWIELNTLKGRAAASTVEALMYSLRSRGVCALAEPDSCGRLAQLSDEQAIEVGLRLRKLAPRFAAPWSADDVLLLMQVREGFKK